jgi:hypothetical protein
MGARALLSVLVTYASSEDGTCWPSQATLADHLGMTQRGVRKLIAELVALELLVVKKRGRFSDSNVYALRASAGRATGTVVPIGRSTRGTMVPVHEEPRFLSHEEPPFRLTVHGTVHRTEGERPPPALTDPPERLAVTDDLRAECRKAGAPEPELEHIVAYLANARAKGLRARDWGAGLVTWMVREKRWGKPKRAGPTSHELFPEFGMLGAGASASPDELGIVDARASSELPLTELGAFAAAFESGPSLIKTTRAPDERSVANA